MLTLRSQLRGLGQNADDNVGLFKSTLSRSPAYSSPPYLPCGARQRRYFLSIKILSPPPPPSTRGSRFIFVVSSLSIGDPSSVFCIKLLNAAGNLPPCLYAP